MGGGALPEGFWAPDVSHFPRPVSQATAALLEGSLAARACREWGVHLDSWQFATDDAGWVFVRDRLLQDPSVEEVEQRAANAADTVARKRWLVELDRWTSTTRDAVVAELLDVQDEPIERYDAKRLADHVLRVSELVRRLLDLHMELHLTDMVPLGALLFEGRDWGLTDGDVIDLMTGSSPASAPSRALHAARAAVAAAGDAASWRELPEVRAFLRLEGHHLVSEPDIAAPVLLECDELLTGLLRAPRDHLGEAHADTAADRVADVRRRVPASARARFDELYADARATFGLRDDNTSLTAMWPMGLARRAYREAGNRLAGLEAPADVFSARPEELARLLTDATAAAALAAALGARTARRRAAEAGPVPDLVGTPPELDLDALTNDQRWLHGALDAYGIHYVGSSDEPLTGVGVGDRKVTGRAVVAVSPADAAARVDTDSILVVRATAPAYDGVLPLVRGLIVEHGGLLCHAAIAARELGLPTLLGVTGATQAVRDGSLVSVDPRAGRATTIEAAPPPTVAR